MDKSKFIEIQQDLLIFIECLYYRGVKVGTLYEWLSTYFPTMPKTIASITKFVAELEPSPVNEKPLKEVHGFIKTKVFNQILFNNKLTKILKVSEETYELLLTNFKENITSFIKDFPSTDLLKDQTNKVQFRSDISDDFLAFYDRTIVYDQVKVDLEDRVSKSLNEEFLHIYGTKEVAFHSFNSVIFDEANKLIIIAHDLDGIIKARIMDKEVNKFVVKVKSSNKGLQFPEHSMNLYGKIKVFYDNTSGYAKDLSFKTPEGLIHHIHANNDYPDARKSPYHKSGEKAVQGKIRLFRIQKGFPTSRNTEYLIDLKSVAAMTTKDDPVLFHATILANNAEDFAEAIQKLL